VGGTDRMTGTMGAGVGIVGLGNISVQYLATIDRLADLRLVAVADIDTARAEAVAAERAGVAVRTVDELLADPAVDVVLNLTIPAAHAEVAAAAIAAGKPVYGEKPLAASVAQAEPVLAAAAAAGLRVGAAPDTVLGTGIQTARKAIDDGMIGRPIAASAAFATPGHEAWHPSPDFYYLPGGGPLFDMGPYYVTSLVTLLGPVVGVVGAGSQLRSTRTIASGPRAGQVVPVEVDTHVSGVLQHASGALSTITMSFDSVATTAARLEVHGETGSLVVPDPNVFDGDVQIITDRNQPWSTLPVSAGYRDGGRGIGLADFVTTPSDATPRASGELAFHVLDVMESLLVAAAEGRRIEIGSTVERPAPVPLSSLPTR